MKTSYRKIVPMVINYWDYKSFSNERFRESLFENLEGKLSGKLSNFSNFINTCNTVLNKHLPKKKRVLEVINHLLWIKFCLKQFCYEQIPEK